CLHVYTPYGTCFEITGKAARPSNGKSGATGGSAVQAVDHLERYLTPKTKFTTIGLYGRDNRRPAFAHRQSVVRRLSRPLRRHAGGRDHTSKQNKLNTDYTDDTDFRGMNGYPGRSLLSALIRVIRVIRVPFI